MPVRANWLPTHLSWRTHLPWRTHSCVPRSQSCERQVFCSQCSQECEHGTLRTCATILLLSFLAGCGSIGEPLYPALHIPSQVNDMVIVERGENLGLAFTIPQLTTEGLPVKEIGEVDLRVGPSTPNAFNQDDWLKTATRVTVPTPDKPGLVQASTPVAPFVGKEVVAEVRVTNAKGRDAGWSSPKVFSVRAPLADPTNFHVAADPMGVALTWNASGPSQFRIYRKTEQQPQATLLATTNQPNYIDISAEYGKTYQYLIQGVRDTVESNLIGPETITPIDVFPPAVPSGLVVSAGVGSLELAWNRNTESDFKEYRVLRSEAGGPFAEIVRGLDAPAYSDHAVQSGKHYRYELESVDQDGHVSAPSTPVEATAP